MKFLGKTLIFMTLLAGIAIHGDDLTEDETQKLLDKELLKKVKDYDVEAVKSLLNNHANPDCDFSDDDTSLMVRPLTTAIVCMKTNIKEVRRYQDLVDEKIRVSDGDEYNFDHSGVLDVQIQKVKCRQSAAQCVEIAKLLLDAKADPNRTERHRDGGYRPLQICSELIISPEKYDLTSVYAMTLLLLDYGVDYSVVDYQGKTIYDYAQTNPKLKKILEKYIKQKIADASTTLTPDPIGIIAGYIL
jgi:hypothetical protein